MTKSYRNQPNGPPDGWIACGGRGGFCCGSRLGLGAALCVVLPSVYRDRSGHETKVPELLGQTLLEGMACGLKPVIHNFLGAGQIFPSEFLFNIAEEFCGQIVGGDYEPRRYRRFVEEKYSQKRQLDRINSIFAGLEAQIDAEEGAESELKCLK